MVAMGLICLPVHAEASPLGTENYPNSGAGDIPLGSFSTEGADDLFGSKSGYAHPFMSVTQTYTDNFFNESTNEQSENITLYSPGIWLSLPGTSTPLLELNTSSSSAGGLSLTRMKTKSDRRFQAYGLYRADIEELDKSTQDTVSHRAEGMLQLNLRGGLSLELINQYLDSHDARAFRGNAATDLNSYQNNLSSFSLSYEPGTKTRLRVDATLYDVNYDDQSDEIWNRKDQSLAFYAFYKFQPKTSVFLEYDLVDVDYDEDNLADSLSDSDVQRYFVGLQWDMSSRSRGIFKAGLANKEFSDSTLSDRNDLILEAQLDHRISSRTSLRIEGTRTQEESTSAGTGSILSNSIGATGQHLFNSKISGNLWLSYTRDSYRGDGFLGGRKDNLYSAGGSLRYDLQKWMNISAGYSFAERDSNNPGANDFDYSRNSLFLSLTLAI